MSFGTWTGAWWLPDAPDRVVQGTLTFSDEELILALDQPLVAIVLEEGQVFRSLWEPTTHSLIHGTVDNGQPATLVLANGNATLVPFGSGTEVWHPRRAMIGIHLVDPEEAVFTGSTVTMRNLDVWLGDRTPELSVQQAKSELLAVSVGAERAVLHEAEAAWGGVCAVAQPLFATKGRRVTVGLLHRIDTTTVQAVSWATIWEHHVLPLHELLVVALGRACPIESLHLTANGSKVVALFRTSDHGRPLPKRRAASHNVLVAADELPGGFGAAINRWYDLEQSHRVAVRALTESLSSPERFASDQIVALVRVVGPLLDRQQKAAAAETADLRYQVWLDKVAAEIADDDIRAAVLGRLNESKANVTDTQRLEVIATELGVVGTWLSGGDINGFAKRVVASRVATAHPSSKAPKNAVAGAELVRHARALSWMLRCAVLARLGVPLDDLRRRAEEGGAHSAVNPAG